MAGCTHFYILKVTTFEKALKVVSQTGDRSLTVRSGIMRIKLGLLLSIAPQNVLGWLKERLALWKGRQGSIGQWVPARANLNRRRLHFYLGTKQINTKEQWLLLKKIQTFDIDLAWETQILTNRWDGDWISSLELYDLRSNSASRLTSASTDDITSTKNCSN